MIYKNMMELMEAVIASTGSVWITEEEIIRFCKKYRLHIDELDYLVEKKIVRAIKNIPIGKAYHTIFSPAKYADWETYVAYDAIRIDSCFKRPNVTDEQIDRLIKEAEEKIGITLHEQQRAAVFCGVKSGFAIITGGPGTGKTCVLQVLRYVLRSIYYDVDIRFTAPTGKAARRITESTGNTAKTVQKELGITYANKNKKMFGGTVLIVDEVSMLDIETAYYTLRSIRNGQKVIFCGDIDQLPSVGPGAVLRDLLFSGAVPYVMLTKTFRQANDTNLFGNIQRIRNGEWQLKQGDDFEIIHTGPDCLNELVDCFLKEYNRYGVENVACLLPYRKAGTLCSDYVNNILQSKVNNPDGKLSLLSYTEKGLPVKFTLKDPVMQLKNREECANGDVGIITKIDNSRVYVQYPQGGVNYSKNELMQLSLAYAMSINKSQGSEYKSVVMGMTSQHSAMLKRNLVYTGVTRAKERCTLLHEDSAMMQAIADETAFSRVTMLGEKVLYYRKKENSNSLAKAI